LTRKIKYNNLIVILKAFLANASFVKLLKI
jgi:hypothetical protein